MEPDGLIEQYLEDLGAALRVKPAIAVRILLEVQSHLAEAVAAEMANGAERPDAERAAIARFGSPQDVARRFRAVYRLTPRQRIEDAARTLLKLRETREGRQRLGLGAFGAFTLLGVVGPYRLTLIDVSALPVCALPAVVGAFCFPRIGKGIGLGMGAAWDVLCLCGWTANTLAALRSVHALHMPIFFGGMGPRTPWYHFAWYTATTPHNPMVPHHYIVGLEDCWIALFGLVLYPLVGLAGGLLGMRLRQWKDTPSEPDAATA